MKHSINYTLLKHLEDEVAAGIPEIMIELIEIYISDSRQTMSALAAALAAGNIRQVELNAHSLKSSSGTFGAEELANVFARMEEMAHRSKLAPIADLLEEAKVKFVEVESILRIERDRLAQS
jgi:HPt (histidine-containing phosphotransfer) domain-containing protein